ncbi:DUF4142 domain-containing protein [Swingsia samuiensis]|nr:DUF4142 domain-containing protein [Swingsia samuiensis]
MTSYLSLFASVVFLSGLTACGVPDAPPAPPLPSAAKTYKLSTADAVFLQQMDALNQKEIKIASLAETHSNSDVVKAFAHTVVGDYTNGQKAVSKILSDGNLTQSSKLTAADEKHINSFKSLYKNSFDRLFLLDVIEVNTPSLQKTLQTEAKSGGSPSIKALASDTLKMLQDHSDRAENISGSHIVRTRHRRHMNRYY